MCTQHTVLSGKNLAETLKFKTLHPHNVLQELPLAGADPVVWYSFGVTHVVRTEDFPVMVRSRLLKMGSVSCA